MGMLARLVLLATAFLLVDPARGDMQQASAFRLWLFADAHVGTDKANGRDSLAAALEQSESASGFDWDVAQDLGDKSGAQGTPKDAEIAGLTRYHGKPGTGIPRSWLLTFADGSQLVTAQCYLHGSEFAPQGWYAKNDKVIVLRRPCRMPVLTLHR